MLQRLNIIIHPKPYRIISLDMEQDERGIPYVWVVAGERYVNRTKSLKKFVKIFSDPQSVSDFLFHRRWYHTILTGFNINFDLNSLKFKGGFEWDVIENMGSFVFARPDNENHWNLKIIELSHFYPGLNLKKACDLVGFSNYIDKHMLGKDGNYDEMVLSCISHAQAAVECFWDIQNQINDLKSNIEITPALTAQKLFLRNYLPKKCQVFHKDLSNETKYFFYKSYYGGRTEVFQLGTHNHTSSIDINSSYPRSMRDEIYPDLMTYREKIIHTEVELIKTMHEYEGLATVSIISPNLNIPLLPFKDNGKLIFPVGQFIGTYTFPELRKALSVGYKINQVYKCGIMKREKEPLFKNYIDALYPLKHHKKYKQIAKLMLNSLYGKFGQGSNYNSGWFLVRNTKKYENQQVDNKTLRIYEGLLYEYIPDIPISEKGFAPKAYPIISAYVTSYSRIHLYESMHSIGFKYIYYCDTDSIYCDSAALNTAIENNKIEIHNNKLGAWKLEHNDITFQIKGLKHYRYNENNEWKYRIKGVSNLSQPAFWWHDSAVITRVRKMKSAIRNGKKVNEFYNMLRVNRDKDHKRIFISNKNSIPIQLTE